MVAYMNNKFIELSRCDYITIPKTSNMLGFCVYSIDYPHEYNEEPVFMEFNWRPYVFFSMELDLPGIEDPIPSIVFDIENVRVKCHVPYIPSLQMIAFESAMYTFGSCPKYNNHYKGFDSFATIAEYFHIQFNREFASIWLPSLTVVQLNKLMDNLDTDNRFNAQVLSKIKTVSIPEQRAVILHELHKRGINYDKGDDMLL